MNTQADGALTLMAGDCLDWLPTIETASVDAVITDPPYELGFMGKGWDATGIAFNAEVWRHCLRVLKPGAHLLAFGGSRTWHRLAVAIEDAGFELRDQIAWLYGQGFPKSVDVAKAIDKTHGIWRGRARAVASGNGSMTGANYQRTDKGDPITPAAKRWQGWGTALKPAFEPVILARKPLQGTVAANVLEHGAGALHIDACRVGEQVRHHPARIEHRDPEVGVFKFSGTVPAQSVTGRWPTNVALDTDMAAELDAHTESANGAASRYFPVFRYQPKAPTSQRPRIDIDGRAIAHPTVKPLDLMKWLVRLAVPVGGLVLDPFAGSGTTLQAARDEGMSCIGIEREAQYVQLICQRLGIDPAAATSEPAANHHQKGH